MFDFSSWSYENYLCGDDAEGPEAPDPLEEATAEIKRLKAQLTQQKKLTTKNQKALDVATIQVREKTDQIALYAHYLRVIASGSRGAVQLIEKFKG